MQKKLYLECSAQELNSDNTTVKKKEVKSTIPKDPGSLDKKYEAPISGNNPSDVSGMAKICRKCVDGSIRKYSNQSGHVYI